MHATLCYRGSEDDVLNRVYNAAVKRKAQYIVDITGDCPLVDPRHINMLIGCIKNTNYDYCSNVVERTWPDGFDIQVYTMGALRAMEQEEYGPVNREHTGWNILQYPGKFKIMSVPAEYSYRAPDWGLTLDTYEDYLLLDHLFTMMIGDYGPGFAVEKVMHYLQGNSHLLDINKNVKRKVPNGK
jgi:spore coat polysaccharide biosynthesis protein SpsF